MQRFDDCVEGGETVIADMFQCAEILRSESPDAFRILTKVPQTFATIDFTRRNKAFYEVRKPVIEVDYDDEVCRSLDFFVFFILHITLMFFFLWSIYNVFIGTK